MKKLIFLLFSVFAFASVHGQTSKFRAEAPHAVIAGEKFQLVYSIDSEASDLRLPQLDNFQVLMGPSTSQSTSMSIINGKVERNSQFSFTYILKASQTGKFTIAPATIVVDGKKVESNSVQIEVVKGDEQAAARQNAESNDSQASGISNDDIFIASTVSKRDVYKDEPILVTTKIYVRSVSLQGISDVKNPELRDFIAQELPRQDNPDWSIETVNGKTYNVGIYEQKLLFPQKTGSAVIEPTELEFLVKQRVARRSQSVFDDFFESNYRTVKKRVSTKPVSISVKQLPSPAPADFSGVVGNIDMKMSVTANRVKTNDAVTIKLDISGTGNHKLMANPKINLPSDFDQFDPKITNNISNTGNGMAGSKTYEYLVIPRHGGEYTIPAITLSYFDLTSRQYKRLTTGDIKISVEKGTSEENAVASQQFAASREDLKFIGKDIRYIKPANEQKLHSKGSFLFGSAMFYLLLLIPALLFGAFVVYAQKQIHENNNVVLSRNKKATKLALKRLKKASELLGKNEKEAFYDEVLRALWGYMGDKLSLPVAKLSRDNASALMTERNVSPETIGQFMQILDTCEFARYAPASGSSEMDKLYHQTIETITQIEGEIKK